MRDNGLGDGDLTSYAVLADIDPTVADLMLDLLRQEGIAAYAGPAPTSRGGMGEVILAGQPVDRLWVRSRDLQAARDLLDRYLADLRPPVAGATPASPLGSASASGTAAVGRSSTDDDAAWQEIIAGFDLTPTDVVPRWPANEDVEPSDDIKSRRRRRDDPPPVWDDAFDDDLDQVSDGEPDDDHFVPLPPPPLPKAQPATRWALFAIAVGVALLMLSAFGNVQDGSTMSVLGLTGIVAGVVTLIARMHNGPPADSGPGNGAVL